MTTCVFTGPTLAPPDARCALDAVYLPPVRQGDVYRAAVRYRPRALGIIDGYFEQVPSVWHKEILWAMAQGIHVFGSASMGALRGAELAPFGMRGAGRIFEAYRDGRLAPYEAEAFEDDDEVAVVHGSAEAGFVPLSEAMVNIRCTLAAASDAAVIAPETRDTLVRLGKELFYPERSYERLLSRGAAAALPAPELDALRAWLPTGRINQKRDDALVMLTAMRRFLAGDPGPARIDYVFQPSEMWVRAALEFEAAEPESEALLDELRLDGRAYVQARRAGLLRMAALRECERQRLTLGDEARRRATAALRRRLGLCDRGALERWLAANDLSVTAFARLAEEEARIERLETLARSWAEPQLLDQLRVTGDYARYATRARLKQRALAGTDVGERHADDWTRFWLTIWYFEERLGAPVPDDFNEYAAGAGFGDVSSFYRALLREHAYVTRRDRLTGDPGSSEA